LISDEDLRLAIDRIARTADGHLLYLYLQKKLHSVCLDTGTLARHEGERLFAAQLIELMREGLIATGTDSTRPFVVGRVDPSAEPARSAREWIARNDPEYTAIAARGAGRRGR